MDELKEKIVGFDEELTKLGMFVDFFFFELILTL
jgi:hypothetical protein